MNMLEIIGFASLVIWMPLGAFVFVALTLEKFVKVSPRDWLEFKRWQGQQWRGKP